MNVLNEIEEFCREDWHSFLNRLRRGTQFHGGAQSADFPALVLVMKDIFFYDFLANFRFQLWTEINKSIL